MRSARSASFDRDAVRRSARAALEQLGHSDIPIDTPVGQLSPAAQQLVEIARALAFGCRVLVLDEPTSSLAHDDVRKLFQLIRRLKQQGLAIVYISHFIEEVLQVSDRFVVLRDGRNAGEGVTSQASGDQIVSLMVGRALEELYPRGPRTVGDALLQPRGTRTGPARVRRRSRCIAARFSALPDCSAPAVRGCFAVFSGSTAVRKGSVKLGIHSGPFAPADWWRHGMGMLSEDRTGEGLATNLNIADNMTMTRLEGPARRFFRVAVTAAAERARVDRAPRYPRGKSRRRKCRVSRAATSRRSRSRGCCTTTWTCWCSTSRRAESMSRARHRFTS